MLSLGIKYSMRNLTCYVNHCARGAKLRYASSKVNVIALRLASLLLQAVNFIPKPSFFRFFNCHFIAYIYFT